ncbi:MAG TPA: PIN domain-containing protein [Polyangiaceae bacterium]|nr:PIN domain-containing protein [Polyangiaceae bacterium]
MGQALILDSEAIHALAAAGTRGALALRSRAILQVAYEQRAPVRVPAPVLAEVCRGSKRDAAVERILNERGIGVVDLTADCARRAGALLEKAKLDSSHAIDAFVVATAMQFEFAVIATGDPRDLQRLASGIRTVRVFAI